MCGIVGLSLVAQHPNAQLVLTGMSGAVRHRGPDSDGQLSTADGRAHLGFRRLAIRDLSPRANQPMVSQSGRTAIVFNGEIYNSHELAQRYLAATTLRTTGDTEVVLEVLERQGLRVLAELNGMFAIALLDMTTGAMTLIRDRMGKKPLYLYQQDGLMAFASELRALKPFGLSPDPKRANLFFHLGYFPSPYTFFEDTTQVCPGEIVQIAGGRIVSKSRFHRFTDRDWGNRTIDLHRLDQELNDAVRIRRLSDVPLGAFLSGGVDSALVAAHLGKLDSVPTPTFTIAFPERDHNEAGAAGITARQLSLPHQVIQVKDQDLPELASAFHDCYEQPYADTSGLVTMLLCGAVKDHVTVALSGDGGDEFFGGYARYRWFREALLAHRLPSFARRLAASAIGKLDQHRGTRLARWLRASTPAELYAEIIRTWNTTPLDRILDRSLLIENDGLQAASLVQAVFDATDGDTLSKAACFDASYYIPDDLQVKLDRASMRVSLEVRCPLLDYRVAEYGIAMRPGMKYQSGLKSALKRLLSRHLSSDVLKRPKRGFNVPLACWLSGPLRELVGDSLHQQTFRDASWIHAATAEQIWKRFLHGEASSAQSVWMLFSLSQHLQATSSDPLFASLAAGHDKYAA